MHSQRTFMPLHFPASPRIRYVYENRVYGFSGIHHPFRIQISVYVYGRATNRL